VEVVEGRVVVELEPVRPLGQGAAVQLLASRILEADDLLVVVTDVRRQDWQVVLRDAGLPRRIDLPNACDVVSARCLTSHVDVTARVLAERGDEVELHASLYVTLRVGDLERLRPDVRVAVVAVDILPEKALDLLIAHDISAADRATSRMGVLENRRDDV
jgi:hypothetical protein